MFAFTPIVSRWGNEYFFLQNLSNWSPKTRKEYFETWLKELSKLPQEVEQLIRKFAEVHRKYPYGQMFLGRPFFTHARPLHQLRSFVRNNDMALIEKALEAVRPYFERIYEKDLPQLTRWKQLLSQTLNSVIVEERFATLSSLYGARPRLRTVNVYLLLSSEDATGGQTNLIDRKSVLVECSRYPTARVDHVVNVVWHEVIHLCFEGGMFLPLVEEQAQHRSTTQWVKEATASALLPNGILAHKGASDHLGEVLQGYIERGQTLDGRYVEIATKILKKKPASR